MSKSAAGCVTAPAATWPGMLPADRADKDETVYVIAGHKFHGNHAIPSGWKFCVKQISNKFLDIICTMHIIQGESTTYFR